eukprot:Skav212198  [mRNA]  locus=scaffold754:623280:624534:+ [translate_table: standard]
MHNGRTRGIAAQLCPAQGRKLLLGRSAGPPAALRNPGGKDDAGHGPKGLGGTSKAAAGFRRRGLELCHSFRPWSRSSVEDRSKPKAKTKSKPKAKAAVNSDSSSGNSSQGGTEEDPLQQLRQTWLGSGTPSGKKKERKRSVSRKRGQRFKMLHKKKEETDEEEDNDQDISQTLIHAAVKADDPLRGLLALQLAQATKKKKKKSKKSRKSKQSSSSSSSRSSSRRGSDSDSSSSDQKGNRGYAKAIKGYRSSGKKMFRYIKKFIKTVEAELGAEDRPYKLTDTNRRIHFGKQQNLKRCHYILAVIRELILKEEHAQAGLQCVLGLQAMHQAAIDGSSMNELARNTEALKKKGSGKGDEDASTTHANSQKEGGKGRGNKGKQREKDKEKTAADA